MGGFRGLVAVLGKFAEVDILGDSKLLCLPDSYWGIEPIACYVVSW